jgi:hypothetical protein
MISTHTNPSGRIRIHVDLPEGCVPVDAQGLQMEVRESAARIESELRILDARCEQRREQIRDLE